MPQAIERLFATPRIRPRFPRMRPASGMHVLEWRPCGAAVLWHRAIGPASTPLEVQKHKNWCPERGRFWEYPPGAGVISSESRQSEGRDALSGFREDIQAA